MKKTQSGVHRDKAIGRIFCPSCRGSEEQLHQWGCICAAILLLHSQSRSITNDMEKQGKPLTGLLPGTDWGPGRGQDRRGRTCWLINRPADGGRRWEEMKRGANTDRNAWFQSLGGRVRIYMTVNSGIINRRFANI